MTDETEIQRLDDDTVARIAAGEVVERPASAVKELVENSLDADASRIAVAVERGGIDGLCVRDDGIGMTEADVRAAVREHTTSKLDDADELERVGTLGFRGEALHTIGAVSRMEITTRPRASPEAGTRLRYVGGDVETVEPAGCPEGTTVEVEDLFFNTPARRKYLGESSTEFRHVSRVVGRYALANPDVAISLSHDGSEVFATTGQGDRRSAIMSVYGREVAESMVDVDAEPSGPVDRIYGAISDPETTRASREYLATYVNDRYVEPDAIRRAVIEAYGGGLAPDRYPFAVLFVDVPPERVDVNVHPRKLAVRFDDEDGVTAAVEDAVREALLDAGKLRSSAPRGRSAPEQTTIDPGDTGKTAPLDDDGETDVSQAGTNAPEAGMDASEADTNAPEAGTNVAEVGTNTPAAGTDATDIDGQDSESTPKTANTRSSASVRGGSSNSAPKSSNRASSDSPASDLGAVHPSGAEDEAGSPTVAGTSGVAGETDEADRVDGHSPIDDSGTRPDPSRKFDATEQRTLDGGAVEDAHEFDRLPPLRVLGQAHDTFLVAESPDGLALIDQHAADERINYERLREALAGETTIQTLADPVELSLTPDEAAVFDDCAPALARLGFHADRDGQVVEVRSVPTVLDETIDPDRLRDVLDALLTGSERSGVGPIEALADELLADLACAPAVTGNVSLTEGSIQELLTALDDCENPYECPHGRPTVIELDTDELGDRFERDYPGHAGRREL